MDAPPEVVVGRIKKTEESRIYPAPTFSVVLSLNKLMDDPAAVSAAVGAEDGAWIEKRVNEFSENTI